MSMRDRIKTEASLFEAHRLREDLDNPRESERPVSADVLKPPQPGSESAGPALFDLVKEIGRAADAQRQLLREASMQFSHRTIIEYGDGQTDASGNIDLPIYQVPHGFEFVTTRVLVEAEGFTPATPYTNAAGWLALIRGQAFAKGAIVDFLPNPPVASGAILPALLTDGASQAGIFKGGTFVSIHIATGPVNTAIYARLQGLLRTI